MPTEIIIPGRRSRRRSATAAYGATALPQQTVVTGPATGMQYATNIPVATTPVVATSYVAPTTPLAAVTPLAAQPVVYPQTVQATTPAPMVSRPLSAPPVASVYGGGVPTVNGANYGGTYGYDPYVGDYGYGRHGGYGGHRGYGVGYDDRYTYRPGYEYGSSGYAGHYPAGYGATAYPGAAYEYAGRPPMSQRIAGDLEELGGRAIDSEEMIARGRARRAGIPVLPSTAQNAMQRGMIGYDGVRYVPGAGPTYY